MTARKKTAVLILAAVVLSGLLYTTTYIPRKLIAIEPGQVSQIEIFDGTLGKSLTVTGEEAEHIVSNLNQIAFSKGKCSAGYLGYRYRLTIYKENGRQYRQLIVNSSDLIRYGNFFYTDKTQSIDIEYLSSLFN